jgi:acyl CoA:acetate/3-ketoacid CoA transferase beta subunit
MVTDIHTILGILMSGSQSRSMGVIGAGQVDRFGNVNTTKVSESGPYLVGSGGANDVASGAGEVLVTLEQSKTRFVEKVPYITSPGEKVTAVVSQMGILEKELGAGELRLTAYFPASSNQTDEEAVRAIQETCGWKLKVSPRLQVLPLPNSEDLKFIRAFDPKRLFLGWPKTKDDSEG